jgi:opacity protein-like surface antigen
MCKIITVCFLGVTGLAMSAFGQESSSPIGLGVKGGVPLNDAFVVRQQNPVDYIADTHRYTFGPYVEVRLPAGFGVELDALYQTYEYRQVVPAATIDQNSHAWEFPLVVKKKFLPGPVKPYLEAGAAFSHLSVRDVRELNDRNTWGLVLGGGVDLKVGRIHFTPEVRYTRWTSREFDSPGTLLQSNLNVASVMLGIGF